MSHCKILLLILFSKADTWAFNDEITHPELTRKAIFKSTIEIYLKESLGISEGTGKKIDGRELGQWIEYGAEMEDHPDCRATNHFHNPRLSWGEAGLTDTWCPFIVICSFNPSFG